MKKVLLLVGCVLWHSSLSSTCNSLNQILLSLWFHIIALWISFLLKILVRFSTRIDYQLAISVFTARDRLSLVQESLSGLLGGLSKGLALIGELILLRLLISWWRGSNWWECIWAVSLWTHNIRWIVWAGIGVTLATLSTLGTHKCLTWWNKLR